MALELLSDDSLFLIDSSDPWYGDILVYPQTQHFWHELSKDNHRRLRHQAQHYLIVGDALYCHGVDTILCQCVTYDEVKCNKNDCQSRACGDHLSGLATAQKKLCAGYV